MRDITDRCKDFEPIIKTVTDTINTKPTQYHINPISILTIDDLLCQIKIKAVRAQCTSRDNIDKQLDELLDIIVYSMLAWKKIQETISYE